MKRILGGLLVLFFFQISYAQYTVVETGRPKANLEFEAYKLAGEKYKIFFKYIPFNNHPERLDSIRSNNQINEEKIISKYGKNWREMVNSQADIELNIIQKIAAQLKTNKLMDDNDLILFNKSKCGHRYRVEIYTLNNENNQRSTKTIRSFKVRKKNNNYYVKMR